VWELLGSVAVVDLEGAVSAGKVLGEARVLEMFDGRGGGEADFGGFGLLLFIGGVHGVLEVLTGYGLQGFEYSCFRRFVYYLNFLNLILELEGLVNGGVGVASLVLLLQGQKLPGPLFLLLVLCELVLAEKRRGFKGEEVSEFGELLVECFV
jgi:hypothetical protein